MILSEGQQFAGFEIVTKIGGGGFGTVYKARQPLLDRFVALKVLHPHLAEDETHIARFRREAEAIANLNHSGIIQLYSAGKQDGAYYIATEFVEGETIQERLRRVGRMPVYDAISVCVNVAEAMKYAWDKARLIHRDIKPANIFLSTKGEVRLGDLGLIKYAGKNTTALTRTDLPQGTPWYMSPEQVRAEHDIDLRSDIYSLGCVLYHMLTGQAPYEGTDPIQVLYKQTTEVPLSIQEALPACAAPLVTLMDRMLAKHPEARYQNYDDLLLDLRTVHTWLLTPQTSVGHKIVLWKPLWTKPALVCVVALLAVGLTYSYFPWQIKFKPRSTPALVQLSQTVDAAFVEQVRALPADQQVWYVAEMLKTLNPRFDGRVNSKVENGRVVELSFATEFVKNIEPVRALAKLQRLKMVPSGGKHTMGMVDDLSALEGLSLTALWCENNPIITLSPLSGMQLIVLSCGNTKIQSLNPVRGMPLAVLSCNDTAVADLKPLDGAPLTVLWCNNTKVKELAVLENMPLQELICDTASGRNLKILSNIPTLQRINGETAAVFWSKHSDHEPPPVPEEKEAK